MIDDMTYKIKVSLHRDVGMLSSKTKRFHHTNNPAVALQNK